MSVKMVKGDLKRGGSRRGFTLVELSLSLVFISILSLTIVLMINNAVESYQRGVTLNQINTVGMDLVDDIRTAVQNSSPKKEEGVKISRMKEGGVNGVEGNVPLFGIFCTGTYTYVWNSGYFYSDGEVNAKLLINGAAVKLAKIEDEKAEVCRKMDDDEWSAFDGGGSIVWSKKDDKGNDKEFVELLGDKDNNLALYDLAVTGPAMGNGTAFYSISFILGTTSGGININATNDFCSAPQNGGDFNYCAINKFNFAAQATGGKSE